MSDVITVLVVDDNLLLRMGLMEIIAQEEGVEAVGMAANGAEAFTQVKALRPDVVTMDYQMPDEDGAACTRRILAAYPGTKVILLSVFDSEEDIWRAVQAGVSGYLTKKAGEVEGIVEAIHSVMQGGTYFPARIAQKLAQRKEQEELTPRELEVLEFLADGNSNKDMAEILGISLGTVKVHIQNLREKLGAVDRTDAVAIGFKRGLLRLEE
ncbi:response regulator transcription factor [Pontiella agarivorans]|uniref:Response regulator transcription factor n=1 Tax=Pontiella agarivorans TaxID=3038953 RepID=A0ABU5MX65_9BACT|nr:response regulator transcription factor [Pontiella agarivorans]MDZ8118770.1 response regulator transcription factor [Pontiella agarivorans]